MVVSLVTVTMVTITTMISEYKWALTVAVQCSASASASDYALAVKDHQALGAPWLQTHLARLCDIGVHISRL